MPAAPAFDTITKVVYGTGISIAEYFRMNSFSLLSVSCRYQIARSWPLAMSDNYAPLRNVNNNN